MSCHLLKLEPQPSCFPAEDPQTSATPLCQLYWSSHFSFYLHWTPFKIFPTLMINCFLLWNFSHAFPSIWNVPLPTVCLIRSPSLSNPKAQLLYHLLCEPTQLPHFSLNSMKSTLFTPLQNQLICTCFSSSELWINCPVSLGSVWYTVDAQCVSAEWIHPYPLWTCSISLHPVDDWTLFAFSHFCLVWRDDTNDIVHERSFEKQE